MSFFTLGIPLFAAIIVWVISGIVLISLAAGVILLCFNQPMAQIRTKLQKRDILITCTKTDMWLEPGMKEYKTDNVYKPAQGVFKKNGPHSHIDAERYMQENTGVKWGHNRVQFFFPGKAIPKMVSQAAAAKRILQIASIHISKDGKSKSERVSILGLKVKAEGRMKPILDRLGITPEYYTVDPESVLKYNEYLCLIAENDRKKALKLIRMYGELGTSNADDKAEAENQLKAVAKEYLVLPEGEDKAKLDASKIEAASSQLIEEIKMVYEFCRDLLVPPTVVAMGEFMSAMPDLNTNDVLLKDIDDNARQRGNAEKPKGLDIKWVVLGMLGEAGVFVLLIIVGMSLLGGHA